MKTISKFLILILIMQLLTGCWDRREVTQMLIVSGVALDKTKDGNIRLTLVAPTPKAVQSNTTGGSSTESNTQFLITGEGQGIMDAYSDIENKLSREIFFSQLESIIIGEKLARDGVSDALDFFSRYHEPPLRVYIMVTKGEALNIFKTNSLLEKNNLEQIRKLENLNFDIKMQLKDFLYSLTEEGIQPIAPVIQRVPVEKNDELNGTQTLSIKGAAVFNNDKLVSFLNSKEARGIL